MARLSRSVDRVFGLRGGRYSKFERLRAGLRKLDYARVENRRTERGPAGEGGGPTARCKTRITAQRFTDFQKIHVNTPVWLAGVPARRAQSLAYTLGKSFCTVSVQNWMNDRERAAARGSERGRIGNFTSFTKGCREKHVVKESGGARGAAGNNRAGPRAEGMEEVLSARVHRNMPFLLFPESVRRGVRWLRGRTARCTR